MEEQYQTIARRLLAEIEAGSFKPDEPIPTRSELAARFKVARATMDRAVVLLVKRGVLNSSRGSGTFVAAPGRDYRIAVLGGEGLPLHGAFKETPRRFLDRIHYARLESKSARAALSSFDALVWVCPEERELSWASDLSGRVPQIVVNRDRQDFNFVSTDHRGAIRQISEERLAAWPDALPVFLGKKDVDGLVWGMREEGFVDACRAASRFYELLPLPSRFDDAVALLKNRFGSSLEKPLVLVSAALANTGPVMAWVRDSKLKFGRDLRYSDFDDDYPEAVWGVQVSSFIQDFDMLVSEAIASVIEVVDGRQSCVRKLVMPCRVNGDT